MRWEWYIAGKNHKNFDRQTRSYIKRYVHFTTGHDRRLIKSWKDCFLPHWMGTRGNEEYAAAHCGPETSNSLRNFFTRTLVCVLLAFWLQWGIQKNLLTKSWKDLSLPYWMSTRQLRRCNVWTRKVWKAFKRQIRRKYGFSYLKKQNNQVSHLRKFGLFSKKFGRQVQT